MFKLLAAEMRRLLGFASRRTALHLTRQPRLRQALELEYVRLFVEFVRNAFQNSGVFRIAFYLGPFCRIQECRPLQKSRPITVNTVNLLQQRTGKSDTCLDSHTSSYFDCSV